MGWLKNLLGGQEKVQPLSINDSNFRDEVLNSPVPVLLDVWTPTCVHCHRLEPIIMGLAQRYRGRLKVTEVNGEEAPRVMQSLGVRGTPTVVYFDQGREVERVTGFRGSLYHQDIIENELLPATNEEQAESAAS
jgi:thioredoxin 1